MLLWFVTLPVAYETEELEQKREEAGKTWVSRWEKKRITGWKNTYFQELELHFYILELLSLSKTLLVKNCFLPLHLEQVEKQGT